MRGRLILEADRERLVPAGIPVDIVFEQGMDVPNDAAVE